MSRRLVLLGALVCSTWAMQILQLTDMHPDYFYRAGTDDRTACHFFNNTPPKNVAGILGDRDCDAPFPLVQGILRWASEQFQPDLIVWNGMLLRPVCVSLNAL
jgi:hypothetical protein